MISAVGEIRRATVRDVPAITSLINHTAGQGLLLPKSLSQVYQNVRDFLIYEEEGEIIACGALHVLWEDLAEIRSLVVREEHRHKGIGRRLVTVLLEDARALGVPRVFALTYKPGFFLRLGFREIAKESLPHKIWADCIDCPKFPHCDETAVILELGL